MKKILVIKIGAIGDVVMALPLISALVKQEPNVNITWVCGRASAGLVKQCMGVSQVIEVEEQRLLQGNLFEKIGAMLEIWIKLFLKKFDLVIIGHVDWRYRLLTLFTRKEEIHHFQRNTKRYLPVPGRHHTVEYIKLAIGEREFPKDWTALPQFDIPLAKSLAERLPLKGKVIALAPGGAKNVLRDDYQRRWPIENYVSLAQYLIKQEMQVILTGSSSDFWICNAFGDLPIINFVGSTTLLDLIALYKKCDVLITHDSGPMHLAGLAGCAIVGLFGPTMPQEKLPQRKNVMALWGGQDLVCRPCYDGKNYELCDTIACMKSISVSQVESAVLNLLKEGK